MERRNSNHRWPVLRKSILRDSDIRSEIKKILKALNHQSIQQQALSILENAAWDHMEAITHEVDAAAIVSGEDLQPSKIDLLLALKMRGL
jgi:hypothetical protein